MIKRKLYYTYNKLIGNTWIRHWRGHGIHSPFMYSMVRNVFMSNNLQGENKQFIKILSQAGINGRKMIIIHNLALHLGIKEIIYLDEKQVIKSNNATFYIATTSTCESTLETLAKQLEKNISNAAIIDINVNLNRDRNKFIEDLHNKYHSVRVRTKDISILFFDNKLQKQCYKLRY